MARRELIERLPQALREYEDISRNNTNPYLLLRSDHTSEWTKEKEMFENYPDVIVEHGYIPTLDIFIDIAIWKLGSNTKRNIQPLAKNTSDTVETHTKAAFAADDPQTAIQDHLRELNGIGATTATGILTFSNPSKYSPMDSFALAALDDYDLGLPTKEANSRYYAKYCQLCRNLRDESNLSTLREVDRALWAIGKPSTHE